MDVPRNSTIADALESLTKDTDATWYPWGRNIVIVPKQALIRVQLNKSITAQFNRVPVEQVLSDLSKRIGVEFKIEPGAVQRVPSEFRSIQLVLDNVPVRQVLDSIAGVTGLNYVVASDGVYIYNQNPNPAAAAVRGRPRGNPGSAGQRHATVRARARPPGRASSICQGEEGAGGQVPAGEAAERGKEARNSAGDEPRGKAPRIFRGSGRVHRRAERIAINFDSSPGHYVCSCRPSCRVYFPSCQSELHSLARASWAVRWRGICSRRGASSRLIREPGREAAESD